MKRIFLGLLGLTLSLSLPAAAAGRIEARKSIEASMLVTGTLLVGPQGQIQKFAIDQPENIEPGVLSLLNRNIGTWTFEPPSMNGVKVAMRNKMSMRVIGKKLENGDFAFRLGGVNFAPIEEEEGTRVVSKKLTPPRYPVGAARAGIEGTVYVIVKIGRDGRVEDAAAEQVNLQYLGNETNMRIARELFTETSIKAAKEWVFTPPVKGEEADDAYWTARVPVDFAMVDRTSKYGEWQAYVPGPRQEVRWDGLRDLPGFSPDALAADGSVYQAGSSLRLLTPLKGG